MAVAQSGCSPQWGVRGRRGERRGGGGGLGGGGGGGGGGLGGVGVGGRWRLTEDGDGVDDGRDEQVWEGEVGDEGPADDAAVPPGPHVDRDDEEVTARADHRGDTERDGIEGGEGGTSGEPRRGDARHVREVTIVHDDVVRAVWAQTGGVL